jgi:hypothetical protein
MTLFWHSLCNISFKKKASATASTQRVWQNFVTTAALWQDYGTQPYGQILNEEMQL